MENRYTSKGMPKLSRETLETITARYYGRIDEKGETDWGKHLQEVQSRLINEDPVLVEFMGRQVWEYPEELHFPMFQSLVGLYAILESQTEINSLDETIIN